ncbi:hypothetical protein [Streptomyces sp. NPDC101145]|uniref:hypothetical protein n=1 Tax=Streptomyces sp. NPDC101145 TaxID=3366112 RepID=UPI00381CEF67
MRTLADRFVPRPDFASRHETVIDAPADAVWAAFRAMELERGVRGIGVARVLMAVRAVLGRAVNRGRVYRDEPSAFTPLAEEPGREVVHGIVGRWWRLGGAPNRTDVATAEQFLAFTEPGYAKGTFGLRLTGSPDGRRTRVVTETRVLCTDEAARRAMRRYWGVIRPFSGLIRKAMLRELRRRVAAR